MKKLLEKLATDFDFDKCDLEEVVENLRDKEEDFEIDLHHAMYRFIHEDHIDEVIKDHLLSDLYVLGSFSDWFISDITKIPADTIRQAQENKCCEVLGELLKQHINEVVTEAIKCDGYGSYLASYDSDEHYEDGFYWFRTN